ncbi:MAG: hypothetical protein AAGI23_09740 [Bacteroidota bacterium]
MQSKQHLLLLWVLMLPILGFAQIDLSQFQFYEEYEEEIIYQTTPVNVEDFAKFSQIDLLHASANKERNLV